MTNFLKNKLKLLLPLLPARLICKLEYKHQSFIGFSERLVEYAFVFKQLARLYPQKILDVGTGITAFPHLIRNCGCLVTASDNIRDYWPSGMTNRHYHIIHDDITNSQIKDKFDLITCISVLEHIEDHHAAIKNMFDMLNPKGHLIVSFPYSENQYIKNVYKLPGSNAFDKEIKFITQSYSRSEVTSWCQSNGGKIIDQEYWQFWSGDFWSVGNQIIPPISVNSEEKHQLTCIIIRKNAG